MISKAIYTGAGWKLMKLGLLLLAAGGCLLLVLLLCGIDFRAMFLALVFFPLLMICLIVLRMQVRLALGMDGLYKESTFAGRRSLLVPWRQVERIDRKKLRFYAPLQQVTIYLSGNRKLRFIMPHAEAFFDELQFRIL